MDQGTQKEEVRNLYLTAEMAAWGDNSTKEKNQMDWLKGRVKEISTWSGASLVALGLLVVIGGPIDEADVGIGFRTSRNRAY